MSRQTDRGMRGGQENKGVVKERERERGRVHEIIGKEYQLKGRNKGNNKRKKQL